jgi:hypothetical protein
MSHGQGTERRVFTRFTIGIPTTYLESGFNTEDPSKTYDISIEGMCLLTNKGLPSGTRLNINLKMLDTGETINVHGYSVWSSCLEPGKYRIGVKLEETKLKPIPIVLRTIKAQRKY